MYQHGGNHLSRQRPTTTIKALSEESASKSSLGSGASSDARNASWDSQGSLASFRSSSDGSPELTPDPPRQLSGEGRRKLLSKKYRHSFITQMALGSLVAMDTCSSPLGEVGCRLLHMSVLCHYYSRHGERQCGPVASHLIIAVFLIH